MIVILLFLQITKKKKGFKRRLLFQAGLVTPPFLFFWDQGNLQQCLKFVNSTPGWRLSMQQHKIRDVR